MSLRRPKPPIKGGSAPEEEEEEEEEEMLCLYLQSIWFQQEDCHIPCS